MLLKITPHGTHDIPHIYHDSTHGTEHPPRYSRYPPTCIMIFSRYCAPPRYCTHVIQGASESPLKIRKITVYCFLISLLVPELLRLKDLKNDRTMEQGTARSWVKSIKIDKICDVMLRTTGCKQSLNLLYYGK